ncbi:MAG: PQQ-binding-like beta-propeller repeat protein [Planctomycetes bacterium]|nr:PQQ-binding-like beta-propeller repeat protein [Planctomycetota bacterium]
MSVVPIPIAGRRFAFVAAVVLMSVPFTRPRDYSVYALQNLADKPQRSWPMFGGSPCRNMVNAIERNIPADWCVEEGKRKNVNWIAELGKRSFTSPVVANGKVFIATYKPKPRDPEAIGPKSALMAFREKDGQFLWQIAHDAPDLGAAQSPSTPTVDGRNLYYITPACEVVCAEADNGKVRWRYDMIKELKVHPYREAWGCRFSALSSPLVIGNLVFAVTGNGVDEEGQLVSPEAPSFIALDKGTGKLIWQSNLPGANIIEAQSSSPTFADWEGTPQVIFAGGDCVIYSFAPETGRLLWKCDCLPTRRKKGGFQVDNYIVGTPVVLGNKLYFGLGLTREHLMPTRSSYFLCLDITKKGDISLKSYEAGSVENKDSALVWAFGGPIDPRPEKGRLAYFGRTVSTAAVHDGLVYIAEEAGYLHCLDAATGKRVWEYDLRACVTASPYWVDGRVFLCTDAGEVLIFAHGRTAKLLATIDMGEPIYTTPVAVNDTLYLTTESTLFAIGSR